MNGALSIFTTLAFEAMADAVRRRIVPVIVAISLVSLMGVDGCTQCSAEVATQGEALDTARLAAWSGTLLFTILGLWTLVLAGMLASEPLSASLEDGSATLLLARPVSRASFAMASLTGGLVVALATGFVLLGATAFLLHSRHDLPLGAAIVAGLLNGLGAVTVGSFAMAASLYLPRLAVGLLVFFSVGGLASLQLWVQLGGALDGAAAWIEQLGPPLASAMVVSLAPWLAPTLPLGDLGQLTVAQLIWAVLGCGTLIATMRRLEIGS